MDPLEDTVEVEEQRARHVKVYRRTQDAKRVFAFGKRRHFYRHGAWRDIDLSLRPAGVNRWLADRNDFVIDADATGLSVYENDSGKGIRFLFPAPPDRVTGRSAFWTKGGVEWEFKLTRKGMKTNAIVAASRGPRTYSFDGQMLGGLAPPNPDQDGNLVQPAGIFTMPRSVAIGSDGVRYPCGPWTRAGGTVSFDFDDTGLPAGAYPYVIDPTTEFTMAGSADDGYVEKSGATWPPSGSPLASTGDTGVFVSKSLFGGNYLLTVGLVRWDTSSLPDDAVVLTATFQVMTDTFSDTAVRSAMVEWYEPGTIGTEDWTSTAVGDAHEGFPLAVIPTGGNAAYFELANVSNVNLAGYTGLRVHISGGAPADGTDGTWNFGAFDSDIYPEPLLIVTVEDVQRDVKTKTVHKSTRGV